MTQARWVSDETLSRSWERLHQLGVVTETTTACLPNPHPSDFSIEDHLFECLDRIKCWLSAAQEIQTSMFTEFLRAHFRSRWAEGRNGPSPSPCIHPPKDFIKTKKGVWRRGLKDLMGCITRGHDHTYGDLLNGGFIPEGEGQSEEEATQMKQRKEQMWMTVMESMEIVWSFLQGIGAPEGISLTGYPDCTSGACWFCVSHKGCLNCEMCGREVDLEGDWVDGTRLVDDSLILDSTIWVPF